MPLKLWRGMGTNAPNVRN